MVDEPNLTFSEPIYMHYLLIRARTILENMARENDRKWWQFWISRWDINDEPLRNDARNLLPLIKEYLST